MRSSLQSLGESVHLGDEVISLSHQLSPTSPHHGSSASTRLSGATSSSQEPGASTRSLVNESVARRHHAQLQQQTPRRRQGSSRPITSTVTPGEGEIRLPRDSVQQQMFSPSVATDDSWDAVESPSRHSRHYRGADDPQPAQHSSASLGTPSFISSSAVSPSDLGASGAASRPVRVKSEPEEDDLALCTAAKHLIPSVTSSQEQQVLASSLPGPPHFQKWLDGIAALNSGDRSSSIDSYYAASIVSAASHPASSQALSSLFQTASEHQLGSAWSPSTRSSGDSYDDLLNPGDLSFESDDSLESLEPTGEIAELQPSVAEGEPESAHKEREGESSTPTSSASAFYAPVALSTYNLRWKIVSVVLALGWSASSLQSLFLSSASESAQQVELGSPIANLTTLPIVSPVDLAALPTELVSSGTSYSTLLFTIALAAIVILFAISKCQGVEEETRARQDSPLLQRNPIDVIFAHENLRVAIDAYNRGQLERARKVFAEIASSACLPKHKRSATEYLGRTLYRLGRAEGLNERFEAAWTIFQCAIDMDKSVNDESASATAKASLGRTLFRLGKLDGARIMLEQAIKLNDQLGYAHEYLAKVHAQMGVGVKTDTLVIAHLEKALEVDSDRCSARVFLGEWLHLNADSPTPKKKRARLQLAEQTLEHVVTIRPDHVSAHARLALLARSRGEREKEAAHWRKVLSIREDGFYDFDLLNETNDFARGHAPIVSLCLALDLNKEGERHERIKRLTELVDKTELEKLPVILRAIAVRHVNETPKPKDLKIAFDVHAYEVSDEEETKTVVLKAGPRTRASRKSSSGSSPKPRAVPAAPIMTLQGAQRLLELEEKVQHLRTIGPFDSDNLEGHGLLSLVLYALGKIQDAERHAEDFVEWREVYRRRVVDTDKEMSVKMRDDVVKCELIERALDEMGWVEQRPVA